MEKVTILMPTYKPKFFLKALKSAIAQTYDNTEILVTDNCPTEEIKIICNEFPKVKYIRNLEIEYRNLATSLFNCNSKYVKPLFDDDILHPFCIERMVESIESNYNISLVFSSSGVIDSKNTIYKKRRPLEKSSLITGNDLHRVMVLNLTNYIGEFSSVLINRDHISEMTSENMFKYGQHDFSRGISDVAFFINILKGKDAYYIDQELSYFRKDDKEQSNSIINPELNPGFLHAIIDWIFLVIESHRAKIITTEEVREKIPNVRRFLSYFEIKYPDVKIYTKIYENYVSSIG